MMKRWLVAFAVVVAAVSVPARASAKETPAHKLVAEGDLVRARGAVITALGGELTAEERAAHLELLVLVERWSAVGARPRVRAAKEEAPIAESENWAESFAAAREALVAGQYAAAEVRLVALSRSAADDASRARAEELATLAHDVTAHDGAPSTPPAPLASNTTEKKVQEWYGWETLICDGASIVTAPVLIGIGGYVLCAPIVHIANGEAVKGLASLGLRLGAPLGFAITGAAIASGASEGRCEMGCGLGGAVIGFGVGIITAITVDAAVLARKEVRRPEKATIVPTGSARADRFELGLAGTF